MKQKELKKAIPKKVYNRWKTLYRHGDITVIAKQSKIQRYLIRDAWLNQQCSTDVFQAMNKFFAARAEEVFGVQSLHNLEAAQ